MGMAAAVGIGVGALTSVGGSLISSHAQSKAADSSLALQKQQFDQTQANEQPFIQAGQTAEGQLSAGTQAGGEFNSPYTMADFQQDPGYNFDLQQGNQAVQRSAAAQGTLNSGGTLKAIENYTQGMASNEFSNAYTRYMTTRQNNYNNLAGIANQGVAATGALAGASTQYGTNAGATSAAGITGSGNALASGVAGAGTAVTSGVNNNALYSLIQNGGLGGNNASSYSAANNSAINSIGGVVGAGLPAANNNLSFGGGVSSDYAPVAY